jgi:hypothetical protein
LALVDNFRNFATSTCCTLSAVSRNNCDIVLYREKHLSLFAIHIEALPVTYCLIYLLLCARLTPPYAIGILITATLSRYVGSGPLFPAAADQMAENCHNYWWANILYIHNYIATDHTVSHIFIIVASAI